MAKEDLLTHEAIILETNAVQRARDLGRDDLPNADADELDTCEMDVVRKCEDRANSLIDQAKSNFHRELSGRRMRSAKEMQAALDGIVSSAEAKILKAYQEKKDGLAEAYKEMKRRQRDYRHFRVVNELTTREPSYVKSKWRRILIISVILALEVLVNGVFLGSVSEGGWMEGAFKIAILSGSIVAAGYVTGYLLRYFKHRRANVTKILAAICCLLGPVYIVLAGYFAAHNRLHILEILSDVEEPLSILDSMLMQPYAPLNSLETLLLIIAAVLSGALAGFEGFASWDIYPGYDKVHRLWESKRAAFEILKREGADHIEASIASLRDDAAEIEKEALANITAVSNSAGQFNLLKADIEQISKKANSVCRSVLKEFREENKKVRSDGRVPKYFSEFPKLEITTTFENEQSILSSPEFSGDAYKAICAAAVKIKEGMALRIHDELEKIDKFYAEVEKGASNDLVEEEASLAEKVSVRD